mmetsp:Transcript_33965/g.101399  ORF Transcript_33965/g.101399 Transcript_33965/m.101399 type:complete len:275 (+) Transcript_33965:6087-6911(+)
MERFSQVKNDVRDFALEIVLGDAEFAEGEVANLLDVVEGGEARVGQPEMLEVSGLIDAVKLERDGVGHEVELGQFRESENVAGGCARQAVVLKLDGNDLPVLAADDAVIVAHLLVLVVPTSRVVPHLAIHILEEVGQDGFLIARTVGVGALPRTHIGQIVRTSLARFGGEGAAVIVERTGRAQNGVASGGALGAGLNAAILRLDIGDQSVHPTILIAEGRRHGGNFIPDEEEGETIEFFEGGGYDTRDVVVHQVDLDHFSLGGGLEEIGGHVSG